MGTNSSAATRHGAWRRRSERARAPGSGASLYLSRLRGSPVTDDGGRRVGRLRDIVVAVEPSGYPPARGVLIRGSGGDRFVPIVQVVRVSADGARLAASAAGDAFQRRDGELLAYRDLLDRQVVDARGARVLRVNDVMFAPVQGRLSLLGIDVSLRGLLRRLLPAWLPGRIEGELLDWSNVEPLAAEMPEVRLRLPHRNLARLNPSDIGRIIDHLPYRHGAELVAALDDVTAADAIEEVEKDRQPELFEQLSGEKAVRILDHMAPDAAADLLSDLPPGRADGLIERMEPEAASDVKLLLSFGSKSAGGLMTTDFVIALERETTREAVEHLRSQLDKPDLVYYVYVVDDPDNRLLRGVVSLRDLLLADPQQRLGDYMDRELRSVQPEDSGKKVAHIMSEYNLLALPVVDAEGRILGLVTADDVLDMVLPETLRRHLPRLFS
ncbi:MAG TPA: CBS domain-containing protein [Casimicrobiaceae bacterium]|nr:CBS domain-containing protein [Casimicrobiaceae bacterium]